MSAALLSNVAYAQGRPGGGGGFGGLGGGLGRPGGGGGPFGPSHDLSRGLERARMGLERGEQVRELAQNVRTDAIEARRRAVDQLIAKHPERYELDRRGELALRGEIVLFAPSAAVIASLADQGFTTLRTMDGVTGPIVVLRAPPHLRTEDALQQLGSDAEDLAADLNHVYLPSAAALDATPQASGASSGAVAVPSATDIQRRVGIIDGAMEATHPAFSSLRVQQRGCGIRRGTEHGTAVASVLAAGLSGLSVELFAADVDCGHGAVDSVVAALGWLVQLRVPVINVSLVGPENRLLRRAVEAVQARGHVLVAAMGNDGPAAPPLYPAAYNGVVAVSAVDARQRVLVEAGRGPHVRFAALGADVRAAAPGGGWRQVRGTSFAAPLVAAHVAAALPDPDLSRAREAIDALARRALDLGSPGWDPVYGHGLLHAHPPMNAASR